MRYYDTARGNDTLLEFNLLYDSQLFRFGILFCGKIKIYRSIIVKKKAQLRPTASTGGRTSNQGLQDRVLTHGHPFNIPALILSTVVSPRSSSLDPAERP